MMTAAVIGLLAAGASASAAPCGFYAYSTDTDPTGLRVRAGPSVKAREIGRLPAAVFSRKIDSYAPQFDVIGAQDNWVRIRNADDYYNDGKKRPIYRGAGWVSGSKVKFTVQSGIGHAGPGTGTPIVVDLGDWFSDIGGRVLAITGCSGKWAKLRYSIPNRPTIKGPHIGEAWFTGICGNQRTTCDLGESEPGMPGGRRPG